METSLHRQLKERYGPGTGGRSEVSLGGFRIDAVSGDGTLVEVQSGATGPLRNKLGRLLAASSSVRVVKPVIVARRVVRKGRSGGADLSARFSPKRGSAFDVFEDLLGLVSLFPHPNLEIEVLAVEIDEVRVSRRRSPGYSVADRRLRAVVRTVRLRVAEDLWALLPDPHHDRWAEPFTTRELADRLGRPLPVAQRVAYCLRHSGAAEAVGKRGNLRVYLRAGPSAAPEAVVKGRPVVSA